MACVICSAKSSVTCPQCHIGYCDNCLEVKCPNCGYFFTQLDVQGLSDPCQWIREYLKAYQDDYKQRRELASKKYDAIMSIDDETRRRIKFYHDCDTIVPSLRAITRRLSKPMLQRLSEILDCSLDDARKFIKNSPTDRYERLIDADPLIRRVVVNALYATPGGNHWFGTDKPVNNEAVRRIFNFIKSRQIVILPMRPDIGYDFETIELIEDFLEWYEDIETKDQVLSQFNPEVVRMIVRNVPITIDDLMIKSSFGMTTTEQAQGRCSDCGHPLVMRDGLVCSYCNTRHCERCKERVHDGPCTVTIPEDATICPKCGIWILKVPETCDDMWCTNCNTGFTFKTREIITKSFHNPHRQEVKKTTDDELLYYALGDDERADAMNEMCVTYRSLRPLDLLKTDVDGPDGSNEFLYRRMYKVLSRDYELKLWMSLRRQSDIRPVMYDMIVRVNQLTRVLIPMDELDDWTWINRLYSSGWCDGHSPHMNMSERVMERRDGLTDDQIIMVEVDGAIKPWEGEDYDRILDLN